MTDTDDWIGIADAAKILDVSAHTLRYYERVGLIGDVGRTSSGHRSYSPANLSQVRFLLRLRAVGMGISDIHEFTVLQSAGPSTVPERLAILRDQESGLAQQRRELAAHARAIADKIAFYEKMLDSSPSDRER